MRVRKNMVNGHNICHGGMIFTLADSAFAHACNSKNNNTIASGCSIEYLAPGNLGDTLTATAIERSRGGKTGVYDITINNQDNITLALFRGKSYQIRGTLLPNEADNK
jgi:acyl-CoA thioesterase